jgi:hypothetical protein
MVLQPPSVRASFMAPRSMRGSKNRHIMASEPTSATMPPVTCPTNRESPSSRNRNNAVSVATMASTALSMEIKA